MADSPIASTSTGTTIAGTAEPVQRPDYQRPEYIAAKPARDLCRALMAGTDGVRALGEVALPRWPAEQREHYKIRATGTQVARYYARTVDASVGMICSTPPSLSDDADALIKSDWEDIDQSGTHGEVFAKHVAMEAVNGGFCGILVDAPPIPPDLSLTLADEQALGLRPFWVLVPADRIISWIVEVPDWAALMAAWASGALTAEQVKSYAKQTVVRQLVLREPTDTTAGSFGVVCRDRYRVLRLTDAGVTFVVWEKRQSSPGGGGEYFALIAQGQMLGAKRMPLTEIPMAIVYGGIKAAPFVAEPPLMALAELNLDHYQVSADRRYLMRLCHAPTLFLAGFTPEKDPDTGHAQPIHVGPNSVLSSSDPQAKASYVAADPMALTSSKEEREEQVRQMAVLGMSFIGKDRAGQVETATGRALDDAAENASHATVARGLQDGLEQALKFHAMYRGVEPPEITVNTTYASPTVDPQIGAILWQAVAAGQLDIESLIQYLATGSLPDDISLRLDTLKQIAADAATNDAAAAADAKANGGNPTPSGGAPDHGVKVDAVGGPAMAARK